MLNLNSKLNFVEEE